MPSDSGKDDTAKPQEIELTERSRVQPSERPSITPEQLYENLARRWLESQSSTASTDAPDDNPSPTNESNDAPDNNSSPIAKKSPPPPPKARPTPPPRPIDGSSASASKPLDVGIDSTTSNVGGNEELKTSLEKKANTLDSGKFIEARSIKLIIEYLGNQSKSRSPQAIDKIIRAVRSVEQHLSDNEKTQLTEALKTLKDELWRKRSAALNQSLQDPVKQTSAVNNPAASAAAGEPAAASTDTAATNTAPSVSPKVNAEERIGPVKFAQTRGVFEDPHQPQRETSPDSDHPSHSHGQARNSEPPSLAGGVLSPLNDRRARVKYLLQGQLILPSKAIERLGLVEEPLLGARVQNTTQSILSSLPSEPADTKAVSHTEASNIIAEAPVAGATTSTTDVKADEALSGAAKLFSEAETKAAQKAKVEEDVTNALYTAITNGRYAPLFKTPPRGKIGAKLPDDAIKFLRSQLEKVPDHERLRAHIIGLIHQIDPKQLNQAEKAEWQRSQASASIEERPVQSPAPVAPSTASPSKASGPPNKDNTDLEGMLAKPKTRVHRERRSKKNDGQQNANIHRTLFSYASYGAAEVKPNTTNLHQADPSPPPTPEKSEDRSTSLSNDGHRTYAEVLKGTSKAAEGLVSGGAPAQATTDRPEADRSTAATSLTHDPVGVAPGSAPIEGVAPAAPAVALAPADEPAAAGEPAAQAITPGGTAGADVVLSSSIYDKASQIESTASGLASNRASAHELRSTEDALVQDFGQGHPSPVQKNNLIITAPILKLLNALDIENFNIGDSIAFQQVRAAFLAFARKNHPDKKGGTQRFQDGRNAYEELVGLLNSAEETQGLNVAGAAPTAADTTLSGAEAEAAATAIVSVGQAHADETIVLGSSSVEDGQPLGFSLLFAPSGRMSGVLELAQYFDTHGRAWFQQQMDNRTVFYLRKQDIVQLTTALSQLDVLFNQHLGKEHQELLRRVLELSADMRLQLNSSNALQQTASTSPEYLAIEDAKPSVASKTPAPVPDPVPTTPEPKKPDASKVADDSPTQTSPAAPASTGLSPAAPTKPRDKVVLSVLMAGFEPPRRMSVSQLSEIKPSLTAVTMQPQKEGEVQFQGRKIASDECVVSTMQYQRRRTSCDIVLVQHHDGRVVDRSPKAKSATEGKPKTAAALHEVTMENFNDKNMAAETRAFAQARLFLNNYDIKQGRIVISGGDEKQAHRVYAAALYLAEHDPDIKKKMKEGRWFSHDVSKILFCTTPGFKPPGRLERNSAYIEKHLGAFLQENKKALKDSSTPVSQQEQNARRNQIAALDVLKQDKFAEFKAAVRTVKAGQAPQSSPLCEKDEPSLPSPPKQ